MTVATNHRTLRCPICGHPELKTRFVSERFEYETDEGPVLVETKDVPVEYCENCGESYRGPKAATIRDRALCQALGFMLPEEIQGLRERLKKTPSEFARLIGVREDRLSEWERGRLIQDRPIDYLLRLLASRPEAVELLETHTTIRPGEVGERNAVEPDDPSRDQPPTRRRVIRAGQSKP